MRQQFQHFIQRAYIERWNSSGTLYVFDKSTRRLIPKQSANRVFGEDNFQTSQMENAFGDVERHIGYIDHQGTIKDPKMIKIFVKWIALHLVRNALNAPKLAGKSYDSDVSDIANGLARYEAFFQDFRENSLITGDNPVVQIKGSEDVFFIAPLSPRRCIYLMPKARLPAEGGNLGLKIPTINQYVFNAASRHCVSFDQKLHLP